jgi:REP element-mobilizing transposase RayT
MTRDNRIEFENSFHHIIIRGYNQMNIFLDEDDFDYFLAQVLIVNMSHGIIIHSYCLMNNHAHLLLQNPLVNLSKSMQLILTRYADYFKRKHKHRGKVLEKRFTSILIDTEMYLMQLAKYIHNNPVEVIIDKPEDWAWSSYKYFLNPKLLQPKFLEKGLILKKHKNLDSLIKYTNEPDDWNPEDHIFSNTILGSEKFIEEITLKHVALDIDVDLKGSFKLNKTYRLRVSKIKSNISKLTSDIKLQSSLLIFALREKTNMTYKEISKEFFFGQAKISSLSDRYQRIKDKARSNKDIEKAIIEIRNL